MPSQRAAPATEKIIFPLHPTVVQLGLRALGRPGLPEGAVLTHSQQMAAVHIGVHQSKVKDQGLFKSGFTETSDSSPLAMCPAPPAKVHAGR